MTLHQKGAILPSADETTTVTSKSNQRLTGGSDHGVPTTYYDLFRVENGFIAEHWDVMEKLADKDTWQNQNGKF